MSSQGPLSPTVTDNVVISDNPWSDAGNILSLNASYATMFAPAAEACDFLVATGFNFTIPDGASIDGIVVEVSLLCDYNDHPTDYATSDCRLTKNGIDVVGDLQVQEPVPTSQEYFIYGSPTDLWGTTFTSAEINNSNFGVLFNSSANGAVDINISVDHIRMTVYYTVSIPGQPPVRHIATRMVRRKSKTLKY